MLPRSLIVHLVYSLIVGLILLACPFGASAQRRGASSDGAGLSTYSRPDGVDDKDALKDFHQAIAVQATTQQVAEFNALVKATEKVKTDLQSFSQQFGQPLVKKNEVSLERVPTGSVIDDATLSQSLQNILNESKKFINEFSEAQKSGLRDTTKRLEKAESELEQEQAKFKQSLQAPIPGSPDILAQYVLALVEPLDKALADFSNEQLALGREMGIVLANGQDLSFNLPAVKKQVRIENGTIAVSVSGTLSQIEVQNGERTFKLELNEDLSDLQQNIEALMHAELDTKNSCRESLAVRQAALMPRSPASLLVLRLHYERWSCSRISGQTSANELGEGEGTVEVKLTPAVFRTDQSKVGMDKLSTLKLSAEFGRIDASGMFADALRSGDLGDELRDKISRAVLAAVVAGTDYKTTLPPALQNSADIITARFRDAGAGVLSVVLEGRTQISNEQANLLASQLNQVLVDKTASPQ